MTYPGGKNGSGIYQKIINLMPPHEIYIEPFLGGAAIFRLKKPAPRSNIVIDRDASCIERLLAQDQRQLPGFIPLVGDALDYLTATRSSRWYRPDTLIYLDPPYLIDSRSSRREIYKYELTDQDHESLLRIVRDLPCMVMISGYWTELYADMLSDWRTVHFQAMTRGGSMASEWIWLNFPPPFELHDYRYLGENFRERERIKRRQLRWRKRLERMPDLERFSMLSMIDEFSSMTAKNGVASDRDRSAGNLTNSGDLDHNTRMRDGSGISTNGDRHRQSSPETAEMATPTENDESTR